MELLQVHLRLQSPGPDLHTFGGEPQTAAVRLGPRIAMTVDSSWACDVLRFHCWRPRPYAYLIKSGDLHADRGLQAGNSNPAEAQSGNGSTPSPAEAGLRQRPDRTTRQNTGAGLLSLNPKP